VFVDIDMENEMTGGGRRALAIAVRTVIRCDQAMPARVTRLILE
jgi:hypothetical protein